LRTPCFSLRERLADAKNNAEPYIKCRPCLLRDNHRRLAEESATFGVTYFNGLRDQGDPIQSWVRRTEDDVGDPCIYQLGWTGSRQGLDERIGAIGRTYLISPVKAPEVLEWQF
jgi:hypothetical protein